MSFNPNNCPTAQDHSLVDFCGNCGYEPTGDEGEEFLWKVQEHLSILKDIATNVIIVRCSICDGMEIPYTLTELWELTEREHPKEDHEDPSKTVTSS